jgi:hypothetical protein
MRDRWMTEKIINIIDNYRLYIYKILIKGHEDGMNATYTYNADL